MAIFLNIHLILLDGFCTFVLEMRTAGEVISVSFHMRFDNIMEGAVI
jgi:hypothetical protein